MALAEAVGTGDQVKALRALRDDVAARMEACTSDQNFAILGRLLSDTLVRLAEAEKASPEKAGTALDELAQRRKGLPNAAGASRAPRSPVGR